MRNQLATIVIIVLLVAGCVGMPISSMLKLRNMDPMTVNAAQLKIAVRADERIGIPEDGVRVSLKFDAEDGSLSIDDTYVVRVIRNPILAPELHYGKAAGESVTLLQLSDTDAQKLTHVQSLLKTYAEGRARGSLSFGVGVTGVCAYSPIPPGEVLIDVFVQARDDDDFFAVTRDLDFRGARDGADQMIEDFTACAESRVSG